MDGTLVFILVACAEEPLRARLGGLLRPAGFAVLKAATAEEALRQALAPVRLAVLQGHLVGVCPHLKAEPLLKGVPVLALADAPVAGADQVVSPRVPSEELLRLVNDLLQNAPPPIARPALTLYRDLIDGLTTHVAILDVKGTIVAVNSAWRQFARDNGGDASRVCEGANYLEACENSCARAQPEARAFADGLRRVLRGNLPEFVHEYPCHSAGELRWFVARVRRLLIGGSAHVLVTHENVTDRKRVEKELAQVDQRLTDTLEGIPDGFIALDRQGQVIYANAGVECCLGHSRRDLLYKNLWQALPDLGRDGLREQLQTSRPGRSSILVEQYFPETGRWAELHAYPTADGLLLHVRDITRQREAREAETRAREKRLRELEKELRELQQLVALPAVNETRRLRDAAPPLFREWVEHYEEALELALEQRAYRVANQTSQKLRDLASRLGFAGAGPRDVIDVHTQAIHVRTRNVTASRAYSYIEEGRLLLVELMGDLASYYRARCAQGE